MKGVEAAQTARYLSAMSELNYSCPFYDTHVHPYEVLFDNFAYQDDPTGGVISIPGRSYAPPSAGAVTFAEPSDYRDTREEGRLREISMMLLKKIYGSIGGKVFLDQMQLSSVDKVLLLPVAAESGDRSRFDERMRWIKTLYGDDERFWIAGSIPPALPEWEVDSYLAASRQQYGIRAVKCHPVVSGIDLGTSGRRKWLEAVVAACGTLQLPLIIHGGRNNPYWGGSRGNFGSIAYLKDIDFSLSRAPVVLAHAAMHRCPIREVEQEALPLLKQMFARHHNLYVDISGLGFEPLKAVLKSLDTERILFGSDALYTPQWEAVALAMHAFSELRMPWEDGFIQIAGINPAKTVFRGDTPC